MKVLITGISGFAGKHLAKLLVSKNIDVFGIGTQKDVIIPHAKYFQCDILDLNKLTNIIKSICPDQIYHLAGFSSVGKSYKYEHTCKIVNTIGTKNLFDSIVNNKEYNPKILIVSSAIVYGKPHKSPITESFPIQPLSPYGESKIRQEKISLYYANKHNLHLIIVRSFTHIGPGQKSDFVVSSFAKQIAEIEKNKSNNIISVGNLDAKRDFTDVRDVVAAYFMALDKGKNFDAYNICSTNSFTIKEILDKLLSYSSASIEVKIDPSKLRPSEIPELVGDNSKFSSLTGWHPQISIESSLKDILDYWRDQIN